jgi:adenine specific DNA methylase Mod
VDLIYLDPPFNSAQDYNVLFKEQSGDRAAAQIKAFEDTWRWCHSFLTSTRPTSTSSGSEAVAFCLNVEDQ